MLKTVSSGGGTTGQLSYQGTWNANTNTPTLVSGTGTKNNYYVVSVAGTTTLDGISSWSVGDWAIFNGTVWEKVLGGTTESFANIAVTTASGYMFANGTSNVTAQPNIPVANVTGAVPNTVYIIAGTGLTGGGALTGNVTISASGGTNGTVTQVQGNGSVNGITLTGNVTTSGNLTLGGTLSGITNSQLQNNSVTIGNTAIALGSTVASLGNVTMANVTINSGTINVTSTNHAATVASTATYGTASLPLQPLGFMSVDLNGTVVKVPYYAV